MNKQKRMIYIYEENLEFYDNLDNKSEFINEAIKQAKLKPQATENPNMDYIRSKIAAIDAQNGQ